MFEKLKMLSARLDELEMRLSAPDLYDDPARAARLLRERNELEPIVEAYRAYERAQQQLADATEMLSDPDMKELAQEELQQAKSDIARLEGELKLLLLPKDPNDEKNIYVEIRGGAGGEEEKSEREPLKLWGHIEGDHIVNAEKPVITAQCFRVPVSDGHTAAVFVSFDKKPSKEEILKAWAEFRGPAQELDLPSAPKQFLHYFEENDRPQPKLDRNTEHGMAVCIGRLREDTLFDYKFACMSHNTLRGAAGGAVLLAELLAAKGYFD